MYADDKSRESCVRALEDLENFLQEEGPFDGVMAFSQGAGLAASLMIHRSQQAHKFPEGSSSLPFRFAIFFCGGVPEDPAPVSSGEGTRRLLSYDEDGEIIDIPTAHIWGKNDDLYPTFGPVLSKLCAQNEREDFVHDGGHEIPGPKDPKAVARTVQIIKRTLARAAA
jgi:predicted esterase